MKRAGVRRDDTVDSITVVVAHDTLLLAGGERERKRKMGNLIPE
jgi:hypothetical protein